MPIETAEGEAPTSLLDGKLSESGLGSEYGTSLGAFFGGIFKGSSSFRFTKTSKVKDELLHLDLSAANKERKST